jgi:ABC-type multidrug transport system fused ATPase/permease subunit
MSGHEHESPGEQVAVDSGTASTTSLSDHGGSSETLGDHDPFQRDIANPLQDILEEGVSAELQQIATALSRHRSHVAAGPQAPEPNPALNPESADFDVTEWVRFFVSQLNEQGHKASELGVLFRDLDVLGSGSALQLQETVDSVLLAPLRVGELFSQTKQHKHILHGFNGLLKSGELLAVLGRPGSGCSTFLKSICGELYGLTLGEKSTVHYNGASQSQMQKEFKGEVIYNQEVRRPRGRP